MPEGKITISADMAQVIGQANKVADAHRNIGRHAGGIGQQWITINQHMGRALLHGTAIAEVLSKAADEMNRFADKSAEVAKGAGGEALDRSLALSKVGAGEGARQVLENGAGGATNKERTQAAEALGSFAEESRFKLSQAQIVRYFALINTGLYKSNELIFLLKRGLPLPNDAEVAQRLQSLTPEARNELQARSQERYDENARNAALTESGARVRAFQSARERAEAEHPVGYGVVNAIEGVPIVGSAAKAAERTDALSETNGILKGIAGSLGRQSPVLNLTGQGETGK